MPDFGKAVQKFGTDFQGGARDSWHKTGGGWLGVGGIDLGKGGRDGLGKMFGPGMTEKLLPGQISALTAGFMKSLPFGLRDTAKRALGDMNDAAALPSSAGAWKGVEADRLRKIGLYVGAGGPQGEQHAKATAKNTERSAKANEQIAANTAGLPGLAPGKFGGRRR